MQNPLPVKKEIALLGGAFDPVTRGHIQAAEYVMAAGSRFHEVWIMPCYSHVYDKHMAASHHRLKMCTIAAAEDSRIKIFDYEIKNRITRGTYFLMQKLLAEDFSRNYNYSMIIGQDNANTFQNWIKYDKLQQLIPFVVIPRKGVPTDHRVSWYLEPPHVYLTKDCHIMNVSSTLVRNMLKQKQLTEVRQYLDRGVLEYILEHNLYQPDNGD